MAESVEDFERKQLEEKLAKMSPEELRAWQKEQCIFCKIVTGAQPAKKVYEDKECIAVLDIFPATPGHVLIIPKEHYMVMPQVPPDTVKHMGMVAKAFTHADLRALGASGSTIFIANGGVAGQRAQHFMIHVIPRKENDGLGLSPSKVSVNPEDESKLSQFLPRVIEAINAAMRGESPEEKPVTSMKPAPAQPAPAAPSALPSPAPAVAPTPASSPQSPTTSPENASSSPSPQPPDQPKPEKKKLDDIASMLLGK